MPLGEKTVFDDSPPVHPDQDANNPIGCVPLLYSANKRVLLLLVETNIPRGLAMAKNLEADISHDGVTGKPLSLLHQHFYVRSYSKQPRVFAPRLIGP